MNPWLLSAAISCWRAAGARMQVDAVESSSLDRRDSSSNNRCIPEAQSESTLCCRSHSQPVMSRTEKQRLSCSAITMQYGWLVGLSGKLSMATFNAGCTLTTRLLCAEAAAWMARSDSPGMAAAIFVLSGGSSDRTTVQSSANVPKTDENSSWARARYSASPGRSSRQGRRRNCMSRLDRTTLSDLPGDSASAAERPASAEAQRESPSGCG